MQRYYKISVQNSCTQGKPLYQVLLNLCQKTKKPQIQLKELARRF